MAKKAVLIVNLGSPDSTEVEDVRRYLDEFLMDPYVIDVPLILRFLIVKLFILPFRPKRSAEAYASIWWEEGSPLLVLSRRLHAAVSAHSKDPVALGMRYGNPSIESAIRELVRENKDLESILLLPLYPHYAMASTLTVIEKVRSVIKQKFSHLKLSYIESYYDYPSYIDTLTNSIKRSIQDHGYDHLLFSFHGVPERHVVKTDCTGAHCLKVNNCCYSHSDAHRYCYSHHVHTTARRVMAELPLSDKQVSISFQSRLGRDPWLSPSTDDTIKSLAKQGVKRLGVVCPAFVSDCLETLEEIGEEGKDMFLEHGGESFTLVPCLNTDPEWVNVILELLEDESKHIHAK